MGGLEAAEGAGGRHQQAVVRPDQHVAAPRPDRDRPPCGPDTGIHHRQVDAHRQVADHPRQQERAVTHCVLADPVGQVEDARVGRDAPHHAAAHGGCRIRGRNRSGTRSVGRPFGSVGVGV